MENEIYDVIIIGAGLSGIGAARQLTEKHPDKKFLILESRASLGGTWDFFKYPGLRSDSDMFTMAYESKPWLGDKRTASDGKLILEYLHDAANEKKIFEKIEFNQTVNAAKWSNLEKVWTIETSSKLSQDKFAKSSGEGVIDRTLYKAKFIFACTGYYNYERAHLPVFEKQNLYKGQLFHAQFWDPNLNYENKKILVIGSGATAVTLVPELAKKAKLVTMLQRSPTYMAILPQEDPVAHFISFLLPQDIASNVIRFKNILFQRFLFFFAKKFPNLMSSLLLSLVRKYLGERVELLKHFVPNYNPWDQRLCLVPDGDFFNSIRAGKADVETGEIKEFIESGVILKDGKKIDVDLVVLATGLELKFMGGVKLYIDEKPLDLTKAFTYRGIMFQGVPNLMYVFGYINASWTLRSELITNYLCRLLSFMKENKHLVFKPETNAKLSMQSKDYIDCFSSGYVARGMRDFPRQGDLSPWRNEQDYFSDKKFFTNAPIENEYLQFH